MRTTRRSLVVIVSVVFAPLAFGQEAPKPEAPPPVAETHAEEFLQPLPPSRGELIELAMEHNPDIVLAKMQVREAEARLRQIQLEVAQQLVEASAELEAMTEELENVNRLADAGRAPSQAQRTVQKTVTGLESRLRYLAGFDMPGVSPLHGGRIDGPGRMMDAQLVRVSRPEIDAISGEVGPILDSLSSLDYSEVELRDMLETISDNRELNIVVDMDLPDQMVNVHMMDIPLRKGLLALTDQYESLCFVVRDYGIFATTRERAMRIPGPAIPEDIPLLVPASSLEPSPERRH